jgi:hypothetical protein
MRKTSSFFLCAVLASLAAPPAAVAQPKPQAEAMNDATRALFTEAVAAYQKKDFPTCRVKALGAWGAKKHAQIASLLGICESALDMHRDAAEHLAFAIEQGEDKHPDRGKDVTAAFAKSRSKIGTLKLDSNAQGADVRKDGAVIAQTPVTLFFDPGNFVLEITKQGYQPQKVTIELSPGKEEVVKAELAMLKQDGAGAGGAGGAGGGVEKPPVEEKPIWPYGVLGGVGALGLGLGIGFTVASVGKATEAEDLACADAACIAEGDDLYSDANLFRGLGIGGFALLGVSAVGMIVYAVVPGPQADATVSIRPWSPGLAGLGVQGTF